MNTGTYDELKASFQEAGRSVTEDMLSRLESKVPKDAFGNIPTSPRLNFNKTEGSVESRIKAIEEQTQKLKEIMNEVLTAKESIADMSVAPPETLKAIAEDLLGIVNVFNNSLGVWYEKTGCVANFTWKYTPYKMLEVAEVDAIIYRKAPPSELTIKEVLENAPTEVSV